jgi:hypothetical protein
MRLLDGFPVRCDFEKLDRRSIVDDERNPNSWRRTIGRDQNLLADQLLLQIIDLESDVLNPGGFIGDSFP